MLNFREEFENIKKAKTDFPQFMAVKNYEKILSELFEMDIEKIETLDIEYRCIHGEYLISAAMNEHGIFFATSSNPDKIKLIFEKMKAIAKENYFNTVIEENSFHLIF